MPEYYRGDQADGISPPDLSKDGDFADHIVHARGKRTQYTSVSLDRESIRDFGEVDYHLQQVELLSDGHGLVEHPELIAALRETARSGEKAERAKALQALRHATRRKEGLVNWRFDISGVARKDLIVWAKGKVQRYFRRTD